MMDLTERVKQVVELACEECCVVSPTMSLSSMAFGHEGVYTVLTFLTEGFSIQVCLPEETPEEAVWNGHVALKYRTVYRDIPIVMLIDAMQAMKDGQVPQVDVA